MAVRFGIERAFGFLRGRRDAKAALDAWFDEVRKAHWASAAGLKRLYRTASGVTAERVVFNNKGNYRLAAAIDFEKGIVWIKWSGAHRIMTRST